MSSEILNEINLEEKMQGKPAEELVKMLIRHCVDHCQAACALQEQHENRLLSVEKKLTAVMQNQTGSVPIVPQIPKWAYPVVFISAVCAGLALPAVVIIYMILVAKGVLPKIW